MPKSLGIFWRTADTLGVLKTRKSVYQGFSKQDRMIAYINITRIIHSTTVCASTLTVAASHGSIYSPVVFAGINKWSSTLWLVKDI